MGNGKNKLSGKIFNRLFGAEIEAKAKEIAAAEAQRIADERRYDARLLQVEENLRSHNKYIEEQKNKSSGCSEIDYFDFENYFRGPREVVKQWQQGYLKYFQGKKKQDCKSKDQNNQDQKSQIESRRKPEEKTV